MGFSHSWNKNVPSVLADAINNVYQESLKVIPAYDNSSVSLYDEFTRAIGFIDDTLSLKEEGNRIMDSLFCEYSYNDDKEPTMITANATEFNFIKTNRMQYDAAVYTALALAKNFDTANILGLPDSYSQTIAKYIEKEWVARFTKSAISEDIIEKLEDIYDHYMGTMEHAFIEAEDSIQYDHVSDLPDYELEYIASRVKEGYYSIYLNNGQIVDIFFRK